VPTGALPTRVTLSCDQAAPFAFALSADEAVLPSSGLAFTATSRRRLALSVTAPAVQQASCVAVTLAASADGVQFGTRTLALRLLPPAAGSETLLLDCRGLIGGMGNLQPPPLHHTARGWPASAGAAAIAVAVVALGTAGLTVRRVRGALRVWRRDPSETQALREGASSSSSGVDLGTPAAPVCLGKSSAGDIALPSGAVSPSEAQATASDDGASINSKSALVGGGARSEYESE